MSNDLRISWQIHRICDMYVSSFPLSDKLCLLSPMSVLLHMNIKYKFRCSHIDDQRPKIKGLKSLKGFSKVYNNSILYLPALSKSMNSVFINMRRTSTSHVKVGLVVLRKIYVPRPVWKVMCKKSKKVRKKNFAGGLKRNIGLCHSYYFSRSVKKVTRNERLMRKIFLFYVVSTRIQ